MTPTAEAAAVRRAAEVRPRSRPHWRVALGAAAIVALAGGAFIVTRPDDAPAPSVFSVPGPPTGIVSDGGHVWVAIPGSGVVSVLDPFGQPVGPPIATGGTPARLAIDRRSAWVADTERGAVVRLPRAGGRAARPVRVGPDVADVAVAGREVWTASSADGTLRRLENGRSRIVAEGVRPIALAADARRVVATDTGAGALLRLRPAQPPVRVGAAPIDVALAGNDAWVADAAAGTVRRVDLAAGVPDAPIPVGRAPVAIAADATAVYVLCRGDRTLVRIDPGSGKVRERLRLEHVPAALTLDPRHVWIAAGQNEVIRVDR